MATRDLSRYIFADRPMSRYVMEFRQLDVGEQERLIAIRRSDGWKENFVMIAAHAMKHACGRFF